MVHEEELLKYGSQATPNGLLLLLNGMQVAAQFRSYY
jgi:hypothetical protein